MAPKKRARASSAPPPAARADPDAEQLAHAAQTGGATFDQALDNLGLDGPLLQHLSYDSEGEDDAPARVVEDEGLIGVAERQPRRDPDETEAARASPTRRAATAATGAKDAEKKLSAAQERFQEDQKHWTKLKTDGTAPVFEQPPFMPYKEGTAPEGFVAKPEHETGGLSPELSEVLKFDTPPEVYMAEVGGFDAPLFDKFHSGSNGYAASKGAGAADHYEEFVPFSRPEIVKGLGLLLRNGVAPTPDQGLAFEDPPNSFVFGDHRIREIWDGKNCGGHGHMETAPVCRCVAAIPLLLFHIQTYAQQDWTKTDPKTGKCVKLDASTAGPLHKLDFVPTRLTPGAHDRLRAARREESRVPDLRHWAWHAHSQPAPPDARHHPVHGVQHLGVRAGLLEAAPWLLQAGRGALGACQEVPGRQEEGRC